MFTGLIAEVGTVSSAKQVRGGMKLDIEAPVLGAQFAEHDSICVDGVCLTVTSVRGSTFTVEAVEETLAKTTLGALKARETVNLEPAMRLGDRLGGHIVQGHVDCVGTIRSIVARTGSWIFDVSFPPIFRRYLIPVGSVAMDGISLTVASLAEESFTLREAHEGQEVNLEFDLMGKYVEGILLANKGSEAITAEKLKRWGYE